MTLGGTTGTDVRACRWRFTRSGFALIVAALVRASVAGAQRSRAALLALSPLLLGWQMVVLKDAQMLGALRRGVRQSSLTSGCARTGFRSIAAGGAASLAHRLCNSGASECSVRHRSAGRSAARRRGNVAGSQCDRRSLQSWSFWASLRSSISGCLALIRAASQRASRCSISPPSPCDTGDSAAVHADRARRRSPRGIA